MQITWVKSGNGVRGLRSAWHIVNSIMAPKLAMMRVAQLQQQGLGVLDARACLKREGFSKSRVSQLLKDYGAATAAAEGERDPDPVLRRPASAAGAMPSVAPEQASQQSAREDDTRTQPLLIGSLCECLM